MTTINGVNYIEFEVNLPYSDYTERYITKLQKVIETHEGIITQAHIQKGLMNSSVHFKWLIPESQVISFNATKQ